MHVRKNIVKIAGLAVLATLLLAACATPGAVETPASVAETPEGTAPPTEASVPTEVMPETRPIEIAAAQVQIEVGSPIPVDVVVSGTWPDLCAQGAQVEQRLAGSRFEIDIHAMPLIAECRPDQLGLPFRMAIPLNMTALPAGTYTVAVNGAETSFEWSNAGSTIQPAAENPAGELRPLAVESVVVEVGMGSPRQERGEPIPVDVVASGTWPDLCAQLAELSQQITGERIEISLSAPAANPSCPPDPVGVPFRIAIPLNMVEMPLGAYSVVVNGVETSFEWPAVSTEPMPIENLGLTFAYIGRDGNLWIADASGGPARQITTDAASLAAGGNEVSYYFPKISSDGRFVAARRDAGEQLSDRVSYQFSLMVYDTNTGESRVVYEDADSPPAGFDWKPGSHLLAYSVGSDPAYFTARGEIDAALATGIFAADMDTGETSPGSGTSLLVEPANGYTLILPVWSPDGRFISFDELVYMEGRGPFTYYDFEAGQYVAWGDPLGNYDWSPDSSTIAYDLLSYAPNGTERIFTRPRANNGGEQQVSPESDQGYSFYPAYSPDGTQLAYLNNAGGPESTQHTLLLQDLASGEVRELGSYENVWYLEWSSDGRALIFSAGPHEAQQVYGYDLARGEAIPLAEGSQPTLAK
jgi:Tol biopolymer transport system component